MQSFVMTNTSKTQKETTLESDLFTVPRAGIEPARPKEHMALNHACLPISAPGQLHIYVRTVFIIKVSTNLPAGRQVSAPGQFRYLNNIFYFV